MDFSKLADSNPSSVLNWSAMTSPTGTPAPPPWTHVNTRGGAAAARVSPDVDALNHSQRHAQSVRLRRFYLAATFSLVYVVLLAAFWWAALLDIRLLLTASACVALNCLIFYTTFRLNWNTRSSEPSLTMPMTLSAIGIMLVVAFFAPATEIIFAPYALCTMAFAAIRLSARALMAVGLLALAGHGGVLLLHYALKENMSLLHLELLHWLVLAATLPAFAILATRIHSLRHALVSAGARIKSIEKSAQRDALTGCFSRKYVFARLEMYCRAFTEGDHALCVAVLDIDQFKTVNDTLGHLGGDGVLRHFVEVCTGSLRENDILGRYGGEEFLLILPQTSLRAAFDICERIRTQIARERWGMPVHRPVTVSIGLTRYELAESALECFSRADAALYAAKQNGRNQVVHHEQKSVSPRA